MFVTQAETIEVKKEEIHLWDIKRILFGQAPPEFLLEVLIRSLIIYLLSLVIMRWLGKRMNGQLTIIELAVMVMLGATVAVPMQMPERGLLQGVVILFCILFALRTINLVAFKHSTFEKTLQGELAILIKDGVLQLDAINEAKISKPQLFAALRNKGILNLSKVKRMYLEGCGTFSIYTNAEERPGLLVVPVKDEMLHEAYHKTADGLVCSHCGWVVESNNESKQCPHCDRTEWTKPIINSYEIR